MWIFSGNFFNQFRTDHLVALPNELLVPLTPNSTCCTRVWQKKLCQGIERPHSKGRKHGLTCCLRGKNSIIGSQGHNSFEKIDISNCCPAVLPTRFATKNGPAMGAAFNSYSRLERLYSVSWLFSAAPRISPSEAPESDDPYCSTASFSSAISRALIERPRRREALSMLVTRAST
ncbi:MAG: hypothetical protein ACI92A_001040 [Candidatus Paceibacteria bacterium]|jgi:hypothetical protein